MSYSAEYLRKRFEERIWESDIANLLGSLPEEESERLVNQLVEGLLIEVDAQ